jgi:hypothetical protein
MENQPRGCRLRGLASTRKAEEQLAFRTYFVTADNVTSSSPNTQQSTLQKSVDGLVVFVKGELWSGISHVAPGE